MAIAVLGVDRNLLVTIVFGAAVVGGAGAGCHGPSGVAATDAGAGGAAIDAQAGTGGGAAGAAGSAGVGGTTGVGGAPGVGGAGGGDPHAWASWPMPNPIATALPNPQSYDTSTDGVVVDRVTGLMWERNVDPGGRLWADAAAYCDALSLGGHDDWRMPALVELISLVDFTQQSPSIDATTFPATPADSFWTSSPVAGSPGELWYVLFTTGFNYPGHSDFLAIKVRCVRTSAGDAGAGDTAPPGRYAFPTSDVVMDTATGLVWQRAAAPDANSWSQAQTSCQSLSLEGTGWRLPSMKELHTIVDIARDPPAIDPIAFPDAMSVQYWTSSPLVGDPTSAWVVDFRAGAARDTTVDEANRARCVR